MVGFASVLRFIDSIMYHGLNFYTFDGDDHCQIIRSEDYKDQVLSQAASRKEYSNVNRAS